MEYKKLLLDCDGVILNSNRIKSEGFFQVALENGFSVSSAENLVEYNKTYGGVSRYKKFQWLIDNFQTSNTCVSVEKLCSDFFDFIDERLCTCELDTSVVKLSQFFGAENCYVVSGADQIQLQSIFKKRDIEKLFLGGIYGSPDSKIDIFNRLKQENLNSSTCIYLGDSELDFEAAKACGIHFEFVYGWSEMKNYFSFLQRNELVGHFSLGDFLTKIDGR